MKTGPSNIGSGISGLAGVPACSRASILGIASGCRVWPISQCLSSILSEHVETASPSRLVALQVYIAESSALRPLMESVTKPKSNVLRILAPEMVKM